MADLARFDELNNLEFAEYFEPMGISARQKKRRIALAEAFFDVFLMALSTAELRREEGAGDSIIEREMLDALDEELWDAIPKDEMDAVFAAGNAAETAKNTEGVETLEEEIKRHIWLVAASVAATTVKFIEKAWYTSYDRAWQLAANEALAVGMCIDFAEAKTDGYKSKAWVTMGDERVRPTHMAVDGRRLPIDGIFTVGDSHMRFPGDSSMGASVSELASCRCWLEFSR